MDENEYIELVKYNAKLSGYDPKRLFVSDKPKKKFYYLTPDDKKIYFGARGYNDFLIYLLTQDENVALIKRQNYRKRHKNDPRNKYSAGEMARVILW